MGPPVSGKRAGVLSTFQRQACGWGSEEDGNHSGCHLLPPCHSQKMPALSYSGNSVNLFCPHALWGMWGSGRLPEVTWVPSARVQLAKYRSKPFSFKILLKPCPLSSLRAGISWPVSTQSIPLHSGLMWACLTLKPRLVAVTLTVRASQLRPLRNICRSGSLPPCSIFTYQREPVPPR